MEIRQFKLLNGDDIIAVMNTRYDGHYIIERPVKRIDSLKESLLKRDETPYDYDDEEEDDTDTEPTIH